MRTKSNLGRSYGGQGVTVQDRIITMRSKPLVRLFVDLDGLLMDKDEDDSILAPAVERFARTSGRLAGANVYYTTSLENGEGLYSDQWLARGIYPVATTSDGVTKDDLNLHLVFDAHKSIVQEEVDTIIIVSGPTKYTALARRAIHSGVTVLLVGNYPQDQCVLPSDSCIYMPTQRLFSESSEGTPASRREQVAKADTAAYQLSGFIKLLNSSESRMPFVGARYFINKVMWRLKDIDTPEERREVFQQAVDCNVVAIYDVENVDGTDNKVSACKLNRAHDLVAETLGTVEKPADDGGVEHPKKKVDVKIDTTNHDDLSSMTPENQQASL